MSQLSIRLPLPFGGVSRQPAHIRFPNQVEDASNAVFNVADGFSKRQGSRFVRSIAGLAAAGDYRLHPIDRDGEERYLVVYGNDGQMRIRVFEIDGREAVVTITANAQGYLNGYMASAADMRLVTIADYTLILNTLVPVQASASDTYTVTGRHRDYDVMVAQTPTEGTFHQAKGDTEIQPAGFHIYDVNGSTFGKRQFATVSGAVYGTPTGLYDDPANSGGFKVFFQHTAATITGGTWTVATRLLVKTGIFAGYTPRAGDQINITGGTGFTAGKYTIEEVVDDDTIKLVSAAGLAVGNQTDVATSGIGREFEVAVEFTTTAMADMFDVAALFQEALQDAGATDATISWTKTAANAGYMTITGMYQGADSVVFAPTAPSSGYDWTQASHPFTSTGSTSTPGTGDTLTVSLTTSERWTRVAPPGQQDARLNALTLPVQMVRTAVATADCAAKFRIDLIDWNQRGSGDKDTNPVPSLWRDGSTISSMAFHRDRLFLAGGENIVGSQTGDLFNFFISDHLNIVDSDPIDVPIASDRVSIIEDMTAFRRSLVILTKAGSQFEFGTPDILSPSTASVTPTTSYKTLPVSPVKMGPFLYFLGKQTGCATLYEYFYDDTIVSNAASDLTKHVEGFIPESITRLVAIQNNNVIAALEGDSRRMFVYQAFWSGTRKDQSAWTEYEYAATYRVTDIAAIENDIYMLVEDTSSGWLLERQPIGCDADDCCVVDEATPSGGSCPSGSASGSGSVAPSGSCLTSGAGVGVRPQRIEGILNPTKAATGGSWPEGAFELCVRTCQAFDSIGGGGRRAIYCGTYTPDVEDSCNDVGFPFGGGAYYHVYLMALDAGSGVFGCTNVLGGGMSTASTERWAIVFIIDFTSGDCTLLPSYSTQSFTGFDGFAAVFLRNPGEEFLPAGTYNINCSNVYGPLFLGDGSVTIAYP